MNEVRIVVTGDGRSAKAALAEARSDWLGFGRDVEQVGAKVSASTRKMRESTDRELGALSASLTRAESAAELFGRSTSRAADDVDESLARMRFSADQDLKAVGVAFDHGGRDADGFAKATDRASSDASRSMRRMRDKIAEALSGIGDISIGVSGGVDASGLFDGVEKEAREAGERAGEEFVRGADGRLRSTLTGRFVAAGKGAADGFIKGFEPAGGQAAKVSALIGAGLLALGPVSQLAGGAVALGLGGGLAAVGVMSAAQSTKVKEEWSGLGDWLKAELGSLDDPIEQALTRIPGIARDAFAQLRGELGESFAQIGPQLEDFAADWGETLGGADLSAETNGFVQVLDAIGDRADDIGAEFGGAFDELSDTAAEHADDIAATIEIIAASINGLAHAAGFIADEFDREMGSLEATFEALGPVASGVLGGMAGDLDNSDAALGRTAVAAIEAGAAYATSAEGADELAGAIQAVNAALEEYFEPAANVLSAQVALDKAADAASNTLDNQNRTIESSEKALSKLVDTMGKRIEADSLLNDNIEESTELMMDLVPEMLALAEGSSEGTDAVNGLIEAIGGTIEQVGKAIVVTDQFGNQVKILPNGKVVKIEAKDEGTPVFNKFMTLIGKAKPPPVMIRADASQAKGVLQDLLRLIGSSSANVSVGVLANQKASGGNIGAYATGGNTRAGALSPSGSAMAIVGEQGRELVRLPYGSTVIPNGQTERMLAEGDGILRGYASGGALGSSIVPTYADIYGGGAQPYGGNLLGAFDPRTGSSGGRVELDVVNPQHSQSGSGGSSMPSPWGGGGWPGGGSGGGGSPVVPGVSEDTTSTYTPITRPTGGKVPAAIDTNPVPASRRGDDFGAGFFAGQTGVSVAGFSGGGGGGGSGGGGSGGGVGLVVNVYVQGSIRAERDIEEIVQNALLRGGFRGAL